MMLVSNAPGRLKNTVQASSLDVGQLISMQNSRCSYACFNSLGCGPTWGQRVRWARCYSIGSCLARGIVWVGGDFATFPNQDFSFFFLERIYRMKRAKSASQLLRGNTKADGDFFVCYRVRDFMVVGCVSIESSRHNSRSAHLKLDKAIMWSLRVCVSP